MHSNPQKSRILDLLIAKNRAFHCFFFSAFNKVKYANIHQYRKNVVSTGKAIRYSVNGNGHGLEQVFYTHVHQHLVWSG